MKTITFVVPCYNSQDYMKRCIDSLLPSGKEGEIIIVDDGSTDKTGEIADTYAALYPAQIKVIHKENGGHGSGVNAGLEAAAGRFFKVVDSDDWLDEKALSVLLTQLKKQHSLPDMVVCNYIYDHLHENRQHRVSFDNVFPADSICSWSCMGRFRSSQYLVMHALIFRTVLLKEIGLRLPEHTFYVDNLFACRPLPKVKRILYLDLDLYHYFLGRSDQSVNEISYMRRIDEQIRVTKLVADSVNFGEVKQITPKLERYLLRNLSIMLSICDIFLLMMKTKEALHKRRQLWEFIRNKDEKLYMRLRFTTISGATYLPGRLGGMLTLAGYRMAKSFLGFA
ncbi:MAG: glycosyltransferase family 2 protein [Lachnospiraceae bacterium]|nr:glycosyltransferase family 2 protein [Lachnospiraceae bacterium]